MLTNIRGSIALLGSLLVCGATADAAPRPRSGAPANVAGDPGIALQVTVGTDLAADACAEATSLDVLVGDRVNFCYRVTNNTAAPLAYQSLVDSVDGAILAEGNLLVAPGDTLQYNRIKQVAGGQDGERSSTWTARDVRPDYSAVPRSGAFIDISTRPSVIDLNPAGDASDPSGAGMVPVTVPFAFPFYGVLANELCVGVDGVAQVGIDRCILFPTSNGLGALPRPGMGTAIVPLWDDFSGKLGACDENCVPDWGTVYADTLGTAPNRQFVIEWYNLRHEAGMQNTDRATFEVIIDEASATIAFEYADVDYTAFGNYFGAPDSCNNGICASIGLQQDDAWATPFSYLQESVISGSAVDFVPNATATFTAQASVTLTIGKPVVSVPATLAGSAAPGAQTTVTLALANTGDRDLHWTLDQGTAAHAPAPSSIDAIVPAYTARTLLADWPTMSNTLLAFDAADPATNAPVGDFERIYDAGTFIDDDFSTLYMMSGWHWIGATVIYTTEVLEMVDTTTAEVTPIGNTGVGPGEVIQGLAWDPVTSTLYATITWIDGSGTTLASIDRYTGAVTRLMPVTGIEGAMLVGLAIDSSGRMYGIEQNSNSLIEIDKASGAATVIGPLGDESILTLTGSLAFDRTTDVLYLSGVTADVFGGLYTVDRSSGHASLIGVLGEEPQLASALAIATAGGPCVNAPAAPWLSFDPAQGVIGAGENQTITVDLDATALAEGTYEANLCLRSNDPYRHTVPVHVTFAVDGEADVVFKDGFDGR